MRRIGRAYHPAGAILARVVKRIVKTLLLPPCGPIALVLIGLALRGHRRRLGTGLAVLGGLALLAATLPAVAGPLLVSLETAPALPPGWTPGGEGAVVVLSGDQRPYAPDAGGATVGPLTLERLVLGARLAKRTGLPLLVTGGVLTSDAPAVARSMAELSARDLGVTPRWVEAEARDTRENAARCAAVLDAAGVTSVVLVTHAWHMPRARAAFERAGLSVTPAPCGFRARPELEPRSFVPSAKSLRETYWALHEWLGRAWYALRA